MVELARSLSIQIDNLCQFLPQDKVVEFAAMTPVELLRSTQRAVAPQDMIDMHEELKDLRRKQKDVQARLVADEDALANLEGRQRLQEADVERMRERQQVERHVEMLEAARPFAEYRSARQTFNDAKSKKAEAQQELTRLTQEVEPSLRAVNSKHRYKEQIRSVVDERKSSVGNAERHADSIDRKFQDLQDKNNDLVAQTEAERVSGKSKKLEVARREQNIARLKKSMEEQPSELDTQSYNERIREKRRAVEECQREIRVLQDKQRESARQGQEKNSRIQHAQENLARLDSQAGKQGLLLQRASSETFRVWEWVQQHQNEFEKHVFGPPIVECSMKDPKYADQIESLLQKSIQLSFTAQTHNDFVKISDQAHQQMGLSEVYIRTVEYGLDQFRSPSVSADDMERFGLDGWALDYIQGPEPVLAMLTSESYLHSTGVSSRETTQQYDLLYHSPITSWVDSKSTHRITRRREYGPDATSVSTKSVRKAAVWTEQPVDITAKRELQESIEGWEDEVMTIKAQLSELQNKILAYRNTIETHQAEQVC